jgi:tetratricopeptide (TPR) repeat protein
LRIRRADLMIRLGRSEEAIALSTLVLDDRDHSTTQRVASCLSLAEAHMAAGRAQEHGRFMHLASLAAESVSQQLAPQLAGIFAEAANREGEAGRFTAAVELFNSAIQCLSRSYDEHWEHIARLAMCVADLYERAGMFTDADDTREEVLRAVTCKLNKQSRLVIDVREDLALGMSSHAEGNFEHAEQMLFENVEIARTLIDPDLLIRTQVALSKAYSARGMYQAALRILRETYQQLSEENEPEVRIVLLKEFGGCLAECGAGEEAEKLFRQAVEEAENIPGPDGIVTQVSLLSSLAGIMSTTNPEEARSKIQRCYDLLDELPPSCEPVSRLDLKLVSKSIDEDGTESPGLGDNATSRLKNLEQRFGHAFPEERAVLMLQKAEALMQSWNREEAREQLERAKGVLEERARTHTVVFAMVLSKLIETLSPDDPQVLEYRQQAEAILERAHQARSQLDNQDEGEQGYQ